MAISDYSTTAASNTAISGIDITGATGKVKDGDNAIRQMMADIKAGVDGVTSFSGLLYGLTLSNNGSDATNDIDIAAGVAIDGGNAAFMRLTSGLTKRLDAAWAVGTNQGGLDTGAIADTTYHVWLIKRSDTGVVDVLFSTSATSPTMPANYDYKRRIGSIGRSGGAIVAFIQNGDYFWRTDGGVSIINTSNPGTSAVLASVGVPSGIEVVHIGNWSIIDATSATAVQALVTSPSMTDTAPSATVLSLRTSGAGASVVDTDSNQLLTKTDTSARVRYRLSASDADITIRCFTIGWIDRRGRD